MVLLHGEGRRPEDKRKDKVQRAHTGWNPKRHIELVSLLLWHKMVAVRWFVWFSLSTVVRQAGGRQAKTKIQVLVMF